MEAQEAQEDRPSSENPGDRPSWEGRGTARDSGLEGGMGRDVVEVLGQGGSQGGSRRIEDQGGDRASCLEDQADQADQADHCSTPAEGE